MDQLWNDRSHVWLRNLERGHYLHADDHGGSVSVHKNRASLNAAWAVHVYQSDRGVRLLLHSAAYGRYLAATVTPAPFGHRGFRVVQADYDQPQVEDIMWQVSEARAGNAVLLRNGGLCLRANGKILRWEKGVTVDGIENESTMMHWIVEPIPLRCSRPPLQDPVRERNPDDLLVVLGLRTEALTYLIRFVLASNDGLYAEDDGGWRSFIFRGRSVRRLRMELARLIGVHDHFNSGLIMCVRAGRYGRLTPLIENLPRFGTHTIQIVIMRSGTPAANELRYPNVDVNAE